MADSLKADTSTSVLSIKDKIRQMRAASAVRREGTRSPSTIPNREPEPAPVLMGSGDMSLSNDKSLPMRAPEPLADPITDAELAPSAVLSSGNLSQRTASLIDSVRPLVLGPREYAIPLPMHARIGKQYEQTLTDYENDIEAFIEAEDPLSNDLIVKMDMLIDRLNNLIKAPDLINISVEEDQQVSPTTAAGWAESCSAKFVFLNDLLEALRSQPIHIVLFAASGRFMDYVETFLIGRQILYNRPDKITKPYEDAAGPLIVTLLPTGEDGAEIPVSTTAAIIAMDDTFSIEDPQVDIARKRRVGELCPIIHLLIPNSPEHIDLCISRNISSARRLKALVSCVDQLRHEIGHEYDDFDAEEAGELVASFITAANATMNWPLPPMPGIPGIDILMEEFSEPSAPAALSTSSTPVHSTVANTTPSSKRPLELDDDDDRSASKKRQRSTPLPEKKRPIPKETGLDVAPAHQVLDQFNASAPPTVQDSPVITSLRTKIETLELQLSEHVSALDSLQERFQARSKEARLYLKERDEALATAKTADTRREDHLATIASLKQDRSRLEANLSETSKALEASTIPEIAALEKAHAEARAATAAQQKAEKRLESMKKDFEFTRQQYQTASTAAVESANEVTALKEENEKLQKQASGEIVKLRELNAKEADSADSDRIKLLEAMLEDREAILARKEDELKNIGRGRGLATRATSVPRSPKAFSRPTSPAPGLLLGPMGASRGGHVGFHPLRNG